MTWACSPSGVHIIFIAAGRHFTHCLTVSDQSAYQARAFFSVEMSAKRGWKTMDMRSKAASLLFGLFVLLSAGSASAQSANPNSDYDMCHVASPPASCASTCGPGGVWCGFAGWTCTWDDTYFLQSKLSKGDEYSFEKNSEGDWLSDADESEAEDICYMVAFTKCLQSGGSGPGCAAAIDPSDMELEWHDVHCLTRVGNLCWRMGG